VVKKSRWNAKCHLADCHTPHHAQHLEIGSEHLLDLSLELSTGGPQPAAKATDAIALRYARRLLDGCTLARQLAASVGPAMPQPTPMHPAGAYSTTDRC